MIAGCSAGGTEGAKCKVASSSAISATEIVGSSMDAQTVTVTIDGSPVDTTGDIGDYLAEQGVSATFFIVGKELGNPSILTRLRDKKHLIANGTFSGKDLTKVPKPVIDLRLTDARISNYVVGNMFLFRSPDHGFSTQMADYLNRQGLQKYVGPIGWDINHEEEKISIDTGCWRDNLSAGDCAQRYVNGVRAKNKGILQFNDGSSRVLELFRELVPALTAAGYKFVRLDEVPEVRRQLQERGAETDITAGNKGCNDY